ncbi:hypothetical protein [Aureimonas altamirensis]|uniref:hypothetical protein n=1 Tax=Aureimonas altamirensis TaxID=370622 RepID=UPI003019C87E
MSQFDFGNLSTATTSGTTLGSMLRSWRDSLHSMHSGSSRPSYAVAGTVWLDTSVTPNRVMHFNGTVDTPLYTVAANGALAISKEIVGLGNVNNTSDAAKPISTATQTALNTKANTESAVTGIGRTITGYGWDQIYTRMSDNTVRKMVADISNNYFAMYYNGTGWPVIRVDATDFPVATRTYVETLVTGRLSGIRGVDIGWRRPTSNAGDFLGETAGDYASGFQMGAQGFVGVFWRRQQMFLNGGWQNIYAG